MVNSTLIDSTEHKQTYAMANHDNASFDLISSTLCGYTVNKMGFKFIFAIFFILIE